MACYGSSSIDVIDLTSATFASKVVSLGASPEGLAVGYNEKVLISTIGTGTGQQVLLTYDPGKTSNPKDKPFTWTDIAYLVNTPQGWRVDDIGFGGNWDFGNKGRMSETLKMVIRTAGN